MTGRADHALRKRAKRTQRERGCWVYIAAEALEVAGVGTHGPPPWYRIVGIGKGRARFVVQLFETGP